MTNSVANIGDEISIGISYFLEKKSKKQPDETYTFGYARYSVIGSVIHFFNAINNLKRALDMKRW